MAKIGVHFLVLFFGLVYNFYKWLYFLLLVDCSHYGCHPSMKVVPQFFPLLGTSCCGPLVGVFCFNTIFRIGFGSLRRKAVDLKGQSGTRLKIPYGICPFFVSSKKRFKSKTFSSSLLFLSPIRGRGSSYGHSFGSLALQL